MSYDRGRPSEGHWGTINRRQLLAALAGVTAGAAAGCTEVVSREFEAGTVGLTEEAREELVLAETARDSETTTRELEEVDIEGTADTVEATITSHTAAYGRAAAWEDGVLDGTGPLGTPLGRFIEHVNGGRISDSAGVTTASRLGIDELTLTFVEGEPTVSSDGVSMVVPAGVRGDDEGELATPFDDILLLMYPPESAPELTQEMVLPSGFVVDAGDFFPGGTWSMDGDWATGNAGRWLPPTEDRIAEELSPDSPVVLALGDNTPEEVFGIPAEELPGERIEEGDSFTGNNPFLVAGPGSVFRATGNNPFTPEELLEVSNPAPSNGATYGVGVLSTPVAEVGGQSANPVATMGVAELLTGEHGSVMWSDAPTMWSDAPTASEIEWLAGPIPVSDVPDGTAFDADSPDGTTVLDREADLRSFLGVVSGEDGPWGVGVHVARVEREHDDGTDVVVAAGTHRWPVASADAMDRLRDPDDDRFTGILGSIFVEARTLTAATGERLVHDFSASS
ncbi:DUF6517 family protein [Haloarchaeobius salinus]|uniref:DUF6517 family protein n=1 Tax=Haloarchaeobius salinus TaxID=1198298 RepID=UPI00210B6D2A|nr:DUF6517 family protein [Haloarchaeobius salinus]